MSSIVIIKIMAYIGRHKKILTIMLLIWLSKYLHTIIMTNCMFVDVCFLYVYIYPFLNFLVSLYLNRGWGLLSLKCISSKTFETPIVLIDATI